MLRSKSNVCNQARLRAYFEKYGSSARNLYDLYDNSRTTVELDRTIKEALDGIDMDGVRSFSRQARGNVQIGQSNISHSVILVYPDPTTRTHIVEVIVCILIAHRLFVKGFEEIVQTYRMFRPLSTGAGWLFEYYCHCMLSDHENRRIELFPLTKVTKSQRTMAGKKVPFRLCRPSQMIAGSFTITRHQRRHFDNGETLELSTEEHCIPSDASKSEYDGFMVLDQSIYAFRMTKGPKHDVKLPGMLELERFARGRPIVYILLVPREREHSDPYLALAEEVLDKAHFFMSIIDVRMDESSRQYCPPFFISCFR